MWYRTRCDCRSRENNIARLNVIQWTLSSWLMYEISTVSHYNNQFLPGTTTTLLTTTKNSIEKTSSWQVVTNRVVVGSVLRNNIWMFPFDSSQSLASPSSTLLLLRWKNECRWFKNWEPPANVWVPGFRSTKTHKGSFCSWFSMNFNNIAIGDRIS